ADVDQQQRDRQRHLRRILAQKGEDAEQVVRLDSRLCWFRLRHSKRGRIRRFTAREFFSKPAFCHQNLYPSPARPYTGRDECVGTYRAPGDGGCFEWVEATLGTDAA